LLSEPKRRGAVALLPSDREVTMESIAARSARLGHANGFDALRLGLAAGIFAFHSFTLTTGQVHGMAWQGEVAARLILPGFFAISGYLVSGSLAWCATLRLFLGLRLLRVLPALAIVTLATALLLGPLLTERTLVAYFADPGVPRYLQNMLMMPHYVLPGLFDGNVRPGIVNGALWTIPLEMSCYGALAALALAFRGRLFLLLTALVPLIFLFGTPWDLPRDFALSFVTGILLFRCSRHVPVHGMAGAAALLAAFWLVTDPARGPLAAPPLAYGAVWLGLHRIPAWLTRADYSYGLYLCGFPQQSFIHLFPAQAAWWTMLAIVLPLSLACAACLWHGVENPILSRRHEILARFAGRFAPLRA
jgi:peptidoglycan/LPS O-acetylase OafA/YrhL